MQGLLDTLEEHSRTWHALGRQSLANAIWANYVTVRFGKTGDPRALDYLYPYLNHSDRQTRLRAVQVASRVFEGRGKRALDTLDYFTKHPDPFLRDRSVQVIGSALCGLGERIVLKTLGPYLNHRNRFVRKQAIVALGDACRGMGSKRILEEILEKSQHTEGLSEETLATLIARVFTGKPSEALYEQVKSDSHALSWLIRGAGAKWYERACEDVDVRAWLVNAAPGEGIQPLNRLLKLDLKRAQVHYLLRGAQWFFIDADVAANKPPLMDLAKNGTIPTQRIAAYCLGRMMLDTEDEEAGGLLRDLCQAKSKAVQAAGMRGLSWVMRSTCDEDLRRLCLEKMADRETVTAAILALGMIFMGSGRSDVFEDLRGRAEVLRAQPVRGREYSKPLAASYEAAGLLYLGTGSIEPVDFLADVLALPRVHRWDGYQSKAANALIMVEFPESALGLRSIGIQEVTPP